MHCAVAIGEQWIVNSLILVASILCNVELQIQ